MKVQVSDSEDVAHRRLIQISTNAEVQRYLSSVRQKNLSK